MQTLLLRVLLLAFIAGAFALAHSWNTGVLLHLKPQGEFDWNKLNSAAAVPGDTRPAGSGETEPPVGPQDQPDQPAQVPTTQPATGATPDQPTTTPNTSTTPDAASNEINLARAKQLFDAQFVGAQQVIFIDARARDIYQQGHIEGAMSLPAGDLGPQLPSKVRNYLPGSLVVIYCQGADCHDSHDVAKRLQAANLGIEPIFIFKDGYPAWVAAGHPTMTGPEVGWE